MKNTNWNHWKNRESWTTKRLIKQRSKPEFLINPRGRSMVDIIPSSQLVIGHGAFSIVYRAKLKTVSSSEHWVERLPQSLSALVEIVDLLQIIQCISYMLLFQLLLVGSNLWPRKLRKGGKSFPRNITHMSSTTGFPHPLNFDFPSLPLPTSYICFIFHLWKRLLGAESSLVTLGGADFHTACMRL